MLAAVARPDDLPRPRPRTRRLLTWLRNLKDAVDLVPSPVREVVVAAVVGAVGLLWAVVLALAESQPAHVVFLAAVWAFAGVAFATWLALWLYWRVQLLRLLGAVEHFLATGRDIHRVLHAERDPRTLPGHLRDLEDWRTAMHRRVLRDPRVLPFREGLTDTDPARDRIWVPLETLVAVRAHLLTYL